MKKAIRNIFVLIVAVVYMATDGYYGRYGQHMETAIRGQHSDAGDNTPALIVSGWLSQTVAPQTSVRVTFSAALSTVKSSAGYFVAIVRSVQHLKDRLFQRYCFIFSKNLIQRLTPPDIIFPFHYFR